MPNIPHQTVDQPRGEENQNAASDKERTSEMMPQNESLYSKLASSLGGIVWEADGAVRLHGITIDITEHEQAEEKSRRISERLRLATGAASIGIERC